MALQTEQCRSPGAPTFGAAISKDISRETTSAAEFWGRFVPNAQRVVFQYQLAQLLAREFQKHWHEEEPHRGSGFRSIKCDGYGLDSKLVKVMASVGISAESTEFPNNVVMWVNPGEVKVRYDKAWSAKIIYTDSESPARKEYHPLALKMQIEPTILCSDESDYASSDCGSDYASRSVTSSPPMSPTISVVNSLFNSEPTDLLWKSGEAFVPRRSLDAPVRTVCAY